MDKLIFKGDYSSKNARINVKLLLVHFVDENGIDFIYSPHLDLTGYGNSEAAAKDSFEIVLGDFIDYTLKKKTVSAVLRELGWKVKGQSKIPKKVTPPSMADVIMRNDYVSNIFDQYPVNTYHQDVELAVPA